MRPCSMREPLHSQDTGCTALLEHALLLKRSLSTADAALLSFETCLGNFRFG